MKLFHNPISIYHFNFSNYNLFYLFSYPNHDYYIWINILYERENFPNLYLLGFTDVYGDLNRDFYSIDFRTVMNHLKNNSIDRFNNILLNLQLSKISKVIPTYLQDMLDKEISSLII